jgi:hypothetical protein
MIFYDFETTNKITSGGVPVQMGFLFGDKGEEFLINPELLGVKNPFKKKRGKITGWKGGEINVNFVKNKVDPSVFNKGGEGIINNRKELRSLLNRLKGNKMYGYNNKSFDAYHLGVLAYHAGYTSFKDVLDGYDSGTGANVDKLNELLKSELGIENIDLYTEFKNELEDLRGGTGDTIEKIVKSVTGKETMTNTDFRLFFDPDFKVDSGKAHTALYDAGEITKKGYDKLMEFRRKKNIILSDTITADDYRALADDDHFFKILEKTKYAGDASDFRLRARLITEADKMSEKERIKALNDPDSEFSLIKDIYKAKETKNNGFANDVKSAVNKAADVFTNVKNMKYGKVGMFAALIGGSAYAGAKLFGDDEQEEKLEVINEQIYGPGGGSFRTY